MTNDEALKRGAEAGWALKQALKEVCGEKDEIAIQAAILAMTLEPPTEASRSPHSRHSRGCG